MATNLVKALAMSAALTSTLTVLSTTANAEYQLIDRVVAIVEDDIVLASDIRDQIVAIKKRITASGGQMPADDVLFEQVLERSILENLQLQRAAQIGLRVSDQQLNDAMTNIAARNQLSLAEFKVSVEAQGDSYLAIRKKIRKDLLLNEVQRRSVIRNISISESESRQFFTIRTGTAITFT